jgi:hypothetical protein
MKASGKEKVSWEETRTRTDPEGKSETYTVTFGGSKEFFKDKLVLYEIDQTLAPGQYAYPFQYQLPPSLPGVIHLKNVSERSFCCNEGKIKYTLKATLDVDGFLAEDLKADCHLVVHSALMQTVKASEDHITKNVNFLCCINKGICTLDVVMDKNVYLPGETSMIQCNIQNGSSVNIENMRCKLYQVIHLRGSSGGDYTIKSKIAEKTFPGVPANATLQQPQPLPLVTSLGYEMTPSTQGNFIDCRYFIDIECDIPWCPDVHLNLPVQIIAPILPPPPATWLPSSTEHFVRKH